MRSTFTLMIVITMFFADLTAQNTTNDKNGNLRSRWAADLDTSNPLPEYPRPQMRRKEWSSLNGPWDYHISKKTDNLPDGYGGKIVVPFALESDLSGVKKRISESETLWYRRSFTIPKKWNGKRILLHFGAVDWEATVYINGKKLGMHQGGYDPFSFDITDALKPSGSQEIIVSAWDPTSKGTQARGKQIDKPRGIWYTPVTGIWQTVWIEPVPDQSITSLQITPDIDNGQLMVTVHGRRFNTDTYEINLSVFDGKRRITTANGKLGQPVTLNIEQPKLWSPDNPFLYDLNIALTAGNKKIDEVSSYFGMRKISVEKDEQGYSRLMLNNSYLFQYGTLDQGWWPDGLYTAPSDEALRYDIEVTKNSGFNMIRKHVKVEPARWYYHCDKIGMLVWQDMPNGDKGADWRGPSGYDGREMQRSAQSAHQYYREWKAIMDANYNKPSIVMWVPFNEGWGQFNTVEVINWTMNYDPSRLVNGPSGGNFFPAGHTVDQHQYPGPGMPDSNIHAPVILKDRVLVLGEFGGLGLPIQGHLWQKDKNWGYRKYNTREELLQNYAALIEKIPDLIKKGLSAAIYTQTTDVEGEVNGLMTYDREVIKMDVNKMKSINSKLYKPYR